MKASFVFSRSFSFAASCSALGSVGMDFHGCLSDRAERRRSERFRIGRVGGRTGCSFRMGCGCGSMGEGTVAGRTLCWSVVL